MLSMKKIKQLKQLLILIGCIQLSTPLFSETVTLIDTTTMSAISNALIAGWNLAKNDKEKADSITRAIDSFGQLQTSYQSIISTQKTIKESAEKTITGLNQELIKTKKELRDARSAQASLEKAQADIQRLSTERDTLARELQELQTINNNLRGKIGLIQAASESLP